MSTETEGAKQDARSRKVQRVQRIAIILRAALRRSKLASQTPYTGTTRQEPFRRQALTPVPRIQTDVSRVGPVIRVQTPTPPGRPTSPTPREGRRFQPFPLVESPLSVQPLLQPPQTPSFGSPWPETPAFPELTSVFKTPVSRTPSLTPTFGLQLRSFLLFSYSLLSFPFSFVHRSRTPRLLY